MAAGITSGPRRAVVVGCAADAGGDEALYFAVVQARLRTCPLIVVATYLRPVDPDLESFDIPDAVLAEHAHKHAAAALQRVARRDGQPLPEHRVVTAQGLPWRVLLHDFPDAGLIVVGAHHRGALRRLLHGQTTAGELVHHSRVPVVVVPSTPARAEPATGRGMGSALPG
ncbi:MAG: hypothetical protein QOE76_2978 [Frankiales bacterium]|jgi:nucleotide-binding universal stress UspA family protein|nr:hypothetical protein [Frankiales bacterium]